MKQHISLLSWPTRTVPKPCTMTCNAHNSVNTLSAKDGDFRLCDGMWVFHIHMLQTTYVHIARCAIQLERRNVPNYFGIKHVAP